MYRPETRDVLVAKAKASMVAREVEIGETIADATDDVTMAGAIRMLVASLTGSRHGKCCRQRSIDSSKVRTIGGYANGTVTTALLGLVRCYFAMALARRTYAACRATAKFRCNPMAL